MLKIFNIPGIWRQLAASLTYSTTIFSCGLSFGWTATIVPHLQKENNTLEMEPLTLDQASWLNAALSFVPLFIVFVGGGFCEILGRKNTGLLIAVPLTLCWLLRLFATNFYHILASQIFYGIADAIGFLLAPLYITEITMVSVRGLMANFVSFAFKIGLLAGYVLGTVLSYKAFTIVGLIIPIFYFVMVLLLPESPVWLARRQRVDDARKSLMWFRNNDSSIVETELKALQEFNNQPRRTTGLSHIQQLFKDPAVIKGQMIGIILVLGFKLSGANIVVLYSVSIFEAAETSIDSYLATIIYGIMQTIGGVLSTITIERFGRRPLLFASTFGGAISHMILGSLFLCKNMGNDITSVGWLPIVAVATYAIMYSIGLGTLCLTVPNELYHPDAASFCGAVTLFMFNLSGFMTTKFFPVLGATIGLDYCFFIMSGCCVGIFLFVYFFIPETKGRTREDLLNELRLGRKVR